MPELTSPLRFTPFLRPLVWGGRNLASILNRTLPTDEPYGESWEISDHAMHFSVVATGPFAGMNLQALMENHAAAILGPATQDRAFPWLIKYLDACDWLSVQVHPDDALAHRLRPGEQGKTEAWFVLSAEPGSRIYAGLQPGVGPEEFRRGLAAGNVANLLHSFTPRAGDCVFLPAGTVHALGGGVMLAEVQQNSDVTLRLFDWNRVDAQGRSRQLHIDEGLEAIDWKRGPVVPVNVAVSRESDAALSLVRCPFFELNFVRHHRPAVMGGQNTLQALIVLEGQARLTVSPSPPGTQGGEGRSEGGQSRQELPPSPQPSPRGRGGNWSETLRRGEVWLLPACLPEMSLEPEPLLEALVCGLP
jgi:mannose-6-phosphate isomerase